MTDLAVIGCGEIGGPVARRLARIGRVLACDPSPARQADLRAAGLDVTAHAADCARARVVLICVATEAQLDAVVADLAAAGGRVETLAVLSTVSPVAMRRAQAALDPAGIAVVDAPVSGGSAGAAAGTLTVIAGGPADSVDALRPVFAAFAARVHHCGPLGAGQVAKIANNVICHANLVLMAEIAALAQRQGLDPAAVAAVMETGTGRNYLTADPAGLIGFLDGFAADPARFDGLMQIVAKDLDLAVGLAGGRDHPAIRAMASVMAGLGAQTRADWLALAGSADQPR